MSESPQPRQPPEGGGDPWAAFGYLVAGVGAYGLLGWGLGVWLHASYLTAVGILVGAVLSLVLIFYQFGRSSDTGHGKETGAGGPDPRTTPRDQAHDFPKDDPKDDRGETE